MTCGQLRDRLLESFYEPSAIYLYFARRALFVRTKRGFKVLTREVV